MKYEVVLYYFHSAHLNQIYDGFARLQKQGVCRVEYKKVRGASNKPLLYANINGKNVIYDTLDGLNWLDGKDLESNIQYFASHDFAVDYYFKRSYSKLLEPYVNKRFQYIPLGLNYDIHPISMPLSKQRIKDCLAHSKIVECLCGKKRFLAEDFTYKPILHNENKILFLTRLWDPTGFESTPLYDEWTKLNNMRIQCVKACREIYKDAFVGGIQLDSFSNEFCPQELIVDSAITRRNNFLKLVKDSNICITTTGLFGSIGWKFAEYLAAARAIITEPLSYVLPGNVQEGLNYLEFTNSDQLIDRINFLLSNPQVMKAMMVNNQQYYINSLQSDQLVRKTLLAIK